MFGAKHRLVPGISSNLYWGSVISNAIKFTCLSCQYIQCYLIWFSSDIYYCAFTFVIIDGIWSFMTEEYIKHIFWWEFTLWEYEYRKLKAVNILVVYNPTQWGLVDNYNLSCRYVTSKILYVVHDLGNFLSTFYNLKYALLRTIRVKLSSFQTWIRSR